MKKIKFAVLGMMGATLLGMTACSTGAKSGDTDSAEAMETIEEQAAPAVMQDSIAAIFTNPDKRSEAATDSTYAQTSTGLKYIIVKEGSGKAPKATDEVTVHYEGKLVDGTIFDSSYQRGEPATFPLNRVIPGWTEGLQLMKEGGKAIFYIPASIGYGAAGAPPVIPPNADLIFTVELIKVN